MHDGGTGLTNDLDSVQLALGGDTASVELLQSTHSPYLRNLLLKKGATNDEIDELLADLWADGLAGSASCRPLFERYNGSSLLRSWLAAIVVNRWISLRRRKVLHAKAIHPTDGKLTAPFFAPEARAQVEMELIHAVEKAVRHAFAHCDAEGFVLLHLVHIHELTRRELAVILRCHESQVGRRLKLAEQRIAEATLEALREFDPLLELSWEDFLALCESTNILREHIAPT